MSSKGNSVTARFPGAAYWLDLGFHAKAAKELARAGFRTLEDLKGKSREDVLAIPGFGKGSLAACERLLGSGFPSRVAELETRGIPPLISRALVRAGFDSFDQVARLTREQYLAQRGLGEKGLRQLEAALGRRLDSPTEELCQEGLQRGVAYRLASVGIRQVQELAHRPDAALRSLGLPAGDVAACRMLIRKAGKGRP